MLHFIADHGCLLTVIAVIVALLFGAFKTQKATGGIDYDASHSDGGSHDSGSSGGG